MTATQRCAHTRAVSVESNGETAAALCPDCARQLPAAWLTCSHENAIELPTYGVRPPYERLCNDCGTGFWPEDQKR